MTLMEKLFEKHMLMNKVKALQKENAELRECLKEAVNLYKCTNRKCEGCSCLPCWIQKARAALEGGK